jgi:small-conductance mechanosensitive channel
MDQVFSAFLRGEVTRFGGAGVVVAALLIFVLRIVLPRHERPRVRLPLFFLLLHIGVVFVRGLLDASSAAQMPLGTLGVLLLGLSLGRSAFLLLVDYLLGRRRVYPLPRIIRDIVQGLVYAGVLLVTLRAAGVEPGSLLATSALLTAVIGLSLQETLGNMFAGLSIQMERPFEVGDWIRFDADEANVGRVVEINWRATKVETLDLVEVVVPNGTLAKAPIRNYSKPSAASRRTVVVRAPYDAPPGKVRDLVLAAIADVPGVLRIPPPSVVTQGFMDSGIEYGVRFFIDRFHDRESIASQVRERIWYALSRAGIPIPLNIRTVYLHEAAAVARQDVEARAERRERILRCVDFIAALPSDAIALLVSRSRVRRYGVGEVIIRQHEAGDELFIVDRGEVVVSRLQDDADVDIARLGANEFFGEMSLTTGERRTATVRAATECELLVVDQAALREVLERYPELAQTISEVVAARQVELEESAAMSHRHSQAIVEEKKHLLLERIRDLFKL